MGVPKFFRFISERYPCLSEVVKQYQIPEFDNLYLDMNGIIHTCSHPDDGNAHFRITEEKIFEDIFHYIEVLFRMIRPQKLFFMAVDGVAPRAKMNQQRGRRFRSAKDAEKLEKEALKRGEELPSEERFDSNCITPGTEFMARLQEQLKYFVTMKISSDKMWKGCKVVLSGHETPGEGEHKIMDYIRYMRSQPGYDPNTRHCLYGLDADLIMLGLCTHEPHFSLLREEVKFGKKTTQKRSSVPEDTTFFLLHLSLLREYLELEFAKVKEDLKGFEYDIEKIIDDWVLMGFLVGNDFIPNLPNLHINDGALPTLYRAYMEVLPTLDGYINEAGKLNLARFEKMLQKLAKMEVENFEETKDDLLYMERKTGRKANPFSKVNSRRERFNAEEESLPEQEKKMDPGLAALIQETEDMILESDEEEEEEDLDDDGDEEFVNYKKAYYRNKLEFANVTPEVMRNQAEVYVRAIQWNLHYYYNGVCSWSWYYPYHYAPYISDIKGFKDQTFEYELGKPFKPYEQLLAVLPPASRKHLPKAYHDLMTQENSAIKNYYPEDFETDLNGKKQEWEAVVLVPFIDEKKLLDAMKPCNEKLTDEEKKRNSHGPMLIFKHTTDDLGPYSPPSYFPTIEHNHANCTLVSIEDIRVPREKLIKGAYPGAKFDVYYPGFPTMKHLKYTGELQKSRVKVFEQPSRNDNMILKVLSDPVTEPPLNLLGKVIYVGWPHLVEAKVVGISEETKKYTKAMEDSDIKTENLNGSSRGMYHEQKRAVIEIHMSRWGIDYGQIQWLVHVQLMVGRKYAVTPNGRVTLEKQFTQHIANYPLHGIVRDIEVYNKEDTPYKDLDSVFPRGSLCFVLANPYYGAKGYIAGIKEGRIRINLESELQPDLGHLREKQEIAENKYRSLHSVASTLSMSKHLFSRLTGTILLSDGSGSKSLNIGLDLKFNKKNMETPGYTKKIDGVWHYTNRVIDLMRDYCQAFPEVVDYLSKESAAHEFEAEEVFGENFETQVKALRDWLKTLPSYHVERRICGSEVLDADVIKELEAYIEEHLEEDPPKQLSVQIKPQFIFNPDLQTGNIMPDSSAEMRLLDRVVNVREGFTVPLGLKGVIIAIHKSRNENEADVVYDVVFDKPFAGGLDLNCSDKKGYRMPQTAFIDISHGIRQFSSKIGKPAMNTSKPRHSRYPDYRAVDGHVTGASEGTLRNMENSYYQTYQQRNSAFASFHNSNQNMPPRSRENRPGENENAPLYSWQQDETQHNRQASYNYNSSYSPSKHSRGGHSNNFMPEYSRGGGRSYVGGSSDVKQPTQVKRPYTSGPERYSNNNDRRENYGKRDFSDNRTQEPINTDRRELHTKRDYSANREHGSNRNDDDKGSESLMEFIQKISTLGSKSEEVTEIQDDKSANKPTNETSDQTEDSDTRNGPSDKPEKPLEDDSNTQRSEQQNASQKLEEEREGSPSKMQSSPVKRTQYYTQTQSEKNTESRGEPNQKKQQDNQEMRNRKINTDFIKTLVKLNSTTNAIDEKRQRPADLSVGVSQQRRPHQPERPQQWRQPRQEVSYSVQLMNYFQANGFGLPRFQFIGTAETRVAQITLPNKMLVMGPSAPTQEEASELAAKAALEELGLLQESSSEATRTFPVPPQQWVENPSSPSKRYQNRNLEFQNKRMPNNSYQRPTNQRISASEEGNKKPRDSTNTISSFVPLQVIRHANTKHTSPSQNLNNKAFVAEAPSSNNQKNQAHIASLQKQAHKKDQEADSSKTGTERKRPQRKMRLAVNFPGKPQ